MNSNLDYSRDVCYRVDKVCGLLNIDGHDYRKIREAVDIIEMYIDNAENEEGEFI